MIRCQAPIRVVSVTWARTFNLLTPKQGSLGLPQRFSALARKRSFACLPSVAVNPAWHGLLHKAALKLNHLMQRQLVISLGIWLQSQHETAGRAITISTYL